MSRFTERLKRLEARRPTNPPLIGCCWHDDDFVSFEGRQIPLKEWERLHPDSKVIHLTWGDDDPQDGM